MCLYGYVDMSMCTQDKNKLIRSNLFISEKQKSLYFFILHIHICMRM